MDPTLKALDLQGIKDLPGELGAFSVESLFVRYNFTYDELLAALAALPQMDDAPEPLKTVVHETTHLFHTTTTPFGFLVYALRRLQASVIAEAINDLRLKHRIKVRYPLVTLCTDFLETSTKASDRTSPRGTPPSSSS